MNREGYHLLGIGGIGMSCLAHLLLDLGYPVSGLDVERTAKTFDLHLRGAEIAFGNHTSIPLGRTVIYSTAIPPSHQSIQEAKQSHHELLHRSEVLTELFQHKNILAVAGTHGKTSTTALLSHTLTFAGLQPSFAIGGEVLSLDRHGAYTCGDYAVVEADESDGSMLHCHGDGAIITNIDNDHLDYWKTKQALVSGFRTFSEKIKNPSRFFWCRDDSVLTSLSLPGISYGTDPEAQLRLSHLAFREETSILTVVTEKKGQAVFTLPLLGQHQALNALAVIGMARALGVTDAQIQRAFASFQGVKRRLEKKGEAANILVYDDYAHHPTAIAKVIDTLKKKEKNRRLVAIFEPHRFTRIQELKTSFISSFTQADLVIVTDICAAGEQPIPGVEAHRLCAEMTAINRKKCHYIPRANLIELLPTFLIEGDVVVTLGAGKITHVSAQLLQVLS